MATAKKAPTRTRRAGIKKTATKKVALGRVAKKPAAKKTVRKKTTKQTVKRSKQIPAKQKKLKPTKKETIVKKGGPLTFPRVVSLSIFTPLVPMNSDQLAISVARFGGTFFVLAGAFFAFLNLQYFNTSVDHTFQAATAVMATCNGHECANESVASNQRSTSQTSTIEFLHPDSTLLQNEVEIKFKTTSLNKVTVAVYDLETGEEHILGDAEVTSKDREETQWILLWDTRQYPDGSYKIYAYGANKNGTAFSKKSDTAFVVENHKNQTSDDSNSGTRSVGGVLKEVTNVTSDLIEKDASVIINSVTTKQNNRISSIVNLHIDAEFAEYIKLSAKNNQTKEIHNLGKAHERTKGNWFFTLDTKKYPDGEYTISVLAVGARASSDKESVTMKFAANDDPNEYEKDNTLGTLSTTVSSLEKPSITLYSLSDAIVDEYANLSVVTKGAQFVELYVLPKQSGMKQFLGLAKKVEDDLWRFTWDTKNTPNGTYEITAHVKNDYGYFVSELLDVRVSNDIKKEPSENEKQYIKQLTLAGEIPDATDILLTTNDKTKRATVTKKEILSSTEKDLDTPQGDEIVREVQDITEIPLLQEKQTDQFNPLLERLAVALRSNDIQNIDNIKENILKQRDIIFTEKNNSLQNEDKQRITKQLDDAIYRVEKSVEITERIIKERTGKSAHTDSDNDGITDFDEVNLYGTDPFVADTDGDGFTDGAEILSGYDPLDASPETLVVYESPIESGITREDILKVENIITAPTETDDPDGVVGAALITGKALPNSFVTLYIFSTPIIVTVRTDADGSWAYKFDKELEDGIHEVYVGVTDNAGKIVAKSEPLRFVKEVQAFTPIDAEAAGTISHNVNPNTFASQSFILIILSISVVAIGLILVLLGLYLSTRQRREFLVAEDSTAVV